MCVCVRACVQLQALAARASPILPPLSLGATQERARAKGRECVCERERDLLVKQVDLCQQTVDMLMCLVEARPWRDDKAVTL